MGRRRRLDIVITVLAMQLGSKISTLLKYKARERLV